MVSSKTEQKLTYPIALLLSTEKRKTLQNHQIWKNYR